jgi:hypothetical protein
VKKPRNMVEHREIKDASHTDPLNGNTTMIQATWNSSIAMIDEVDPTNAHSISQRSLLAQGSNKSQKHMRPSAVQTDVTCIHDT